MPKRKGKFSCGQHRAAGRFMGANMNHFIINLTDSADLDQQIAVGVEESGDIGCAAQLAIDKMLSNRVREMAFPLFVDIHRAEDFPQVASHYEGARTRSVGLN